MLSENASIVQNLVTFLIVAYIAFCILYGYVALLERRRSAGRLVFKWPASFASVTRDANARYLAKVAGAFSLPVIMLAVTLSFTGRERSGVIEATNLFTVSARPDASIAYLAAGDRVEKNEIVARFDSDGLDHRIAGLQSRRQELLARRDAIKASTLSPAADVLIELQSQEQRLTQLEHKLTDLERAAFAAEQQLVTEEASWRRANTELAARIPTLEQSLASEMAEHKTAVSALQRVRLLRENGHATITQFERASDAETLASNRVNSTRAALDSTRGAIATLESGYRQTEALLKTQLVKLASQAQSVKERMQPVTLALERLRPTLAQNEHAAAERRRLEIAAAEARITELDAEIAGAIAMAQVKSPVAGRVLYRTTASGTLSGAMPLLVIASSDGLSLRIDLPRDERPAVEHEMLSNSQLEVVVDDGSVRRLALARVARIEDAGIDAKRFTAVLSVQVPEDMLVRMAVKGTAPQAVLRWTPSVTTLITTRIASALGFTGSPPSRMARLDAPVAPAAPVPPTPSQEQRHAFRHDL